MTTLGSLSSVNLIAGAGILGNIGGVPITSNAQLTNNISTYTSLGVVSQFVPIAGSGYVSINIVANTLPALTNAIPTAYQGNLGSGTLTSAISTQANLFLGNGDLGIFEQIFSSAQSFVSQTNQLIKSTINGNSSNNTTGFTSQDNIITGGFINLTEAFGAVGQDLLKLGELIDLANLNNLGSPAALLRQLDSQGNLPPGVATALLAAGVPQETISDVNTVVFTPAVEKLCYQAMTQVKGADLKQVLKLLNVKTAGLETMADLLNPVKILPNSYITLTAPTVNGIRGVYVDTAGSVNTNLETTLPASVLYPLKGSVNVNATTYAELRKVIPPDQALANKALEAALQQVKTIFNSNLPAMASAVSKLETNVGLNLINALTEPLPPNVAAFFTTQFNTGTGPDGILLLTDVIGTPTGWVHNEALSNTITIMTTMTDAGVFANLTNSYNGVYTVMANTLAGDYTTTTLIDPGDPFADPPIPPTYNYTITIPSGLPAAGTYGPTTSESSTLTLAFSALNSNMLANVNSITINNSAQTNQLNSNWANIASQIVQENNNVVLAQIDFANLTPGVQPIGLVTNLSQYGVETVEGGAAYYMESIANTQTQGGQAMISTMRESRNQVRLNAASIETTIIVSDEVPEPQADLSSGQYTVSQAVNNKII